MNPMSYLEKLGRGGDKGPTEREGETCLFIYSGDVCVCVCACTMPGKMRLEEQSS
jgi:hypothetical protein